MSFCAAFLGPWRLGEVLSVTFYICLFTCLSPPLPCRLLFLLSSTHSAEHMVGTQHEFLESMNKEAEFDERVFNSCHFFSAVHFLEIMLSGKYYVHIFQINFQRIAWGYCIVGLICYFLYSSSVALYNDHMITVRYQKSLNHDVNIQLLSLCLRCFS